MNSDCAVQTDSEKAGHSIKRLGLSCFRNYDLAKLTIDQRTVILTGANGAGKTNILEAISFFSPGRGLRNASIDEVQTIALNDSQINDDRAEKIGWAVHADFYDSISGNFSFSTGIENQENSTVKAKRFVHLEKANQPQSALADYTAILWLTPQMDRLFLDSASHRRRFLDRLVFTFDPAHSGRTTRYEKAIRQRAKLLKDQINEPAWLASLEETMAQTGVAIAAARLRMLERLQSIIDEDSDKNDNIAQSLFPKATLDLDGYIEQDLKTKPALSVEKNFQDLLEQTRRLDAQTGGAKHGVHKTDLLVTYQQKNMPAAQCSTGEQKALLTALILSHARLVLLDRGIAPILLLDEIAAHYDDKRRQILFEHFYALGNQIWITGTEKNLFDYFSDKADFFTIDNGQILKG